MKAHNDLAFRRGGTSQFGVIDLIQKFKTAIEQACDRGEFIGDVVFCSFPVGCCGDTCYLLAEFLHQHKIETICVSGKIWKQTHAWLVIKNKDIQKKNTSSKPKVNSSFVSWPNKCTLTVTFDEYYTPDDWGYKSSDLENGIIVDITADQFGEEPVYVGAMDSFHRNFEFMEAHDYIDLGTPRLLDLYNVILKYIK